LYEVYKKVKADKGEKNALVIAAQINNTEIVPLTDSFGLVRSRYQLEI
jgi:hypothetical protein